MHSKSIIMVASGEREINKQILFNIKLNNLLLNKYIQVILYIYV